MEKTKTFTQQEVEGIISQINNQARIQCENIAKKCRFLEEQLMYKRLDYLFKVVENKSAFTSEFVDKCIKETESILTIPEDIEKEGTKEGED